MTYRATCLTALLLGTIFATTAQAAVTLQGTRIIHDAGKGRDVTVQATNRAETPAMVQVWVDGGDSHARPEDLRMPFRLTPAEPRLMQGKQSQAFRITYAPRPSDTPLPTNRESVFYFNLLDIPPKPANATGQNLLQFAVRTRVKLFYRPTGLSGKPVDAASQLRWTLVDGSLEVHNPSAYHVTLMDIGLSGGAKIEGVMIAPGARNRLPVPKGAIVASALKFQWLDDYGTPRNAEAMVGP